MRGASVFLGLWISAVVACSADSEEASDVAGQAIVDGQPALDFKLVGMLRHASDWNCSGTLIGPDIVLTAAHCLAKAKDHDEAFPYTKGLVEVAPAFKFYPEVDGNGYFRSSIGIDVDRVYGIGDGEGASTADNPDVALVHLVKPVVRPAYARIADALPSPGTQVVAVGFGCKSYPGSNFFTRRKRSVSWDDLFAGMLGAESGIFTKEGVSGILCPVDSGGALLSTDGLTIYGVAFGGSTTVSGWVNVTTYRDAISNARFRDAWGQACAKGNGSWCTDIDGNLAPGYLDVKPGEMASSFLLRCVAGRPFAGPKLCPCVRETAGAPDHCR